MGSKSVRALRGLAWRGRLEEVCFESCQRRMEAQLPPQHPCMLVHALRGNDSPWVLQSGAFT